MNDERPFYPHITLDATEFDCGTAVALAAIAGSIIRRTTRQARWVAAYFCCGVVDWAAGFTLALAGLTLGLAVFRVAFVLFLFTFWVLAFGVVVAVFV
jgi:hypothetical protein